MLPPTDQFIAFIIASLALAITPGADMTFVITSTARGGLKNGLMALSGTQVGCLLHITFATLGLTALLATIPGVFIGIKYAGCAYLLYMAYQLFTAKDSEKSQNNLASTPPTGAYLKIARQAFFINLLNPKVGLFFMAFLPQFIDVEKGHAALQTATLGLVFVFIGCGVILTMAIITAYSAHKMKKAPYIRKIARWFAGALLGSFAIRLGTTTL